MNYPTVGGGLWWASFIVDVFELSSRAQIEFSKSLWKICSNENAWENMGSTYFFIWANYGVTTYERVHVSRIWLVAESIINQNSQS